MIYETEHPDSSNLVKTKWNSETRIMTIDFRSGLTYVFYDIPKKIYDYVAAGAPRGGKEFWKSLGKSNYTYRVLTGSI